MSLTFPENNPKLPFSLTRIFEVVSFFQLFQTQWEPMADFDHFPDHVSFVPDFSRKQPKISIFPDWNFWDLIFPDPVGTLHQGWQSSRSSYHNLTASAHPVLCTATQADPGGPLAPKIFFSKSCSFQAILRGKPPFWAKFWLRAPLGSKLRWAPLTKILDPPLSQIWGQTMLIVGHVTPGADQMVSAIWPCCATGVDPGFLVRG